MRDSRRTPFENRVCPSRRTGISPIRTQLQAKESVVDTDRIEGKAKETEGEIQQKWGEAKDSARDAWEDVKDKTEDVVDRGEDRVDELDERDETADSTASR
jgi:uncharacterized protein YjbJ (UPF0337 family)